MKVLVAGASGFLGGAILRAVVADGHEVTALSRSPRGGPAGAVKWVSGDVVRPETLGSALAGQEVVIDAVQFPNSPIENPKKGYTFERVDFGGTRNLVDAAVAAGVGRFIGLSGAGAAADAPYFWQRFKWAEEQHIRASGLEFTIFRPSWVYGPGDGSLNRFLAFAKFLPFIPVIGDGKTRVNPVFIDDLAAHLVAAISLDTARGQLFEIGGPDILTMDQIIRAALKASGKRRFLLHQPKPLMKFVASIVQHAPGRPLTPDAIDFITMEGLADTKLLTSVFGRRLTPLNEALATYLPR